MSLYKQGESEALESFPYGQICSYGVSDSNTFRITAGDRDLIFETTKVKTAHLLQLQKTKCVEAFFFLSSEMTFDRSQNGAKRSHYPAVLSCRKAEHCLLTITTPFLPVL